MKTVTMNLNDVKPHPINTSVYNDFQDPDKLKGLIDSMYDNGQLMPIVVNQNSEIISGNRRVAAARFLKMMTIEAIQMELRPDEEALLIVNHNVTRQKSCAMKIAEFAIIKERYGKGRGTRTDLDILKNPALDKKRRGDIYVLAADMLNMKKDNLKKLLNIHKSRPELIKDIDDEKLTINRAHNIVNPKDSCHNGDDRQASIANDLLKPLHIEFNLSNKSDVDAILKIFHELVAKYQEAKKFDTTLDKILIEATQIHEEPYLARFNADKEKMKALYEDIDAQLQSGQYRIIKCGTDSCQASEIELGKFKEVMKPNYPQFRTETDHLNREEISLMSALVINDAFQVNNEYTIRLNRGIDTTQFQCEPRELGVDYFIGFLDYLQFEHKIRSNKSSFDELRTIQQESKKTDEQLLAKIHSLFSSQTNYSIQN